MGAAIVLAVFAPYSSLETVGGLLELTSIIAGAVTIFSTNAYGREIGWEEYERAHKSSFVSSPNERSFRVFVPLVSIAW
jgi:hypothetical protein